MNLKALGAKIKHLRESRGLSLEELAGRAKVAKNGILALEHGRGNPTVGTLEALSRTLGEPLIGFYIDESGKGTIPASDLTPAAYAGLRQIQKGARKRMEAEVGRKLPNKFEHIQAPKISPEDLRAGLDFVSKFSGQSRDTQLFVMALVYEKPAYVRQVSPEFREQLVQLLSAAQR